LYIDGFFVFGFALTMMPVAVPPSPRLSSSLMVGRRLDADAMPHDMRSGRARKRALASRRPPPTRLSCQTAAAVSLFLSRLRKETGPTRELGRGPVKIS